MTCSKQVYLLPHSLEEFPPQCRDCGAVFGQGWQTLRHWIQAHLQTGEPERGQKGRYNIRAGSETRYSNLGQGAIVLFVKDRRVVGAGRVEEVFQEEESWDNGQQYSGYIVIGPETLRVFNPPTDLAAIPGYQHRWPRWGPERLPDASHPAVAILIAGL